jgi:hypothetical protein
MENLGKHPYRYKIRDIESHIRDFVENDLFEEAKKAIDYIKTQYINAINSREIDYGSFMFGHLEDYGISDLKNSMAVIKYADGSKYKFIYELNQLAKWVEDKKLEKTIETAPKTKITKDGRTTQFYALIHFYQRSTIGLDDSNKDQYGKQYGFVNGSRLLLDFRELSDHHNRIEEPKGKTKIKNRIELLKRVQRHLPDDIKGGKVLADIKALEARFYADYT